MKKFLIILACLLILQTGVGAEEASDVNYGYIKPEIVELFPAENLIPKVEENTPGYYGTIELPERFDARELGAIHYSGLGQKSDGTCWTFASVLCTETALGGKVNLSEQHLKYASSYLGNNPYGYIRTPVDGGNFYMYTAYASNWRGPVLESDDPYIYDYDKQRDYATVTAQKPVAYHLQGTINIPNPASKPSMLSTYEKAEHIEEIKYYVYNYKCLFSSIYWSSSYYDSKNTSYYNYNTNADPNHAINIIGWDDNYPKENFLEQPKNDGAFIIKNSHGSTGGYFYLSYEDIYAGWEAGAVTLVEDRFNYGEIYTHEYFEPGASIPSVYNMAKTTNVFTSRHDGEYVSAVGVTTISKDLSYKVYLSKTDEGDADDESEYTLCGEGYIPMPGFHTLELSKAFPLGDKGTKYCVRVVYESNKNFNIPLEYKSEKSIILNTYAKPGESYLSLGGNYKVSDMGESYNANLFVKAYTDAEYDIDFETENIKYSINGSEFKPGEDTTAGLNDEITLEFTNLTSTYSVNGKEYPADTKTTVTITGDLLITENHTANIKTESGNESLTLDTLTCSQDSYSVSVTPEFEGEKTVIVAYYNHHKEVGVKAVKVSTNNSINIETQVSENPDSLNVIIIDNFTSLNTEFNPIHLELNN